MKKLKKTTISRIKNKGHVIRTVETPKGVILIWSLEESRGYQTGFKPKKFKYVELPQNAGVFSYQNKFNEHWKKCGFI